LLEGKSEPTVGLVGNTIVAADGFTPSGDSGDTEGYNVATNAWKSFNSDPTPRNGACGGGIATLVYVAGGYPGGGPGSPAYSFNESFSVSANKWVTLDPLPQATVSAGSAVYKGQLYCIGGTSTHLGTVLNNVQIYQP
jgi:Kelch motif